MRWDPNQYAKYADERGRPFLELLDRIGADCAPPGRRPRLRPRHADDAARRPLARARR